MHAQLCDVRRDDCGDWGVEEVGRVFGGAAEEQVQESDAAGLSGLEPVRRRGGG